MEVYLIRHGQSTNNALMEDNQLRVQDPPLTKVGEQQAELTAQFLQSRPNLEELVRQKVDDRDATNHPHKFDYIYCSPMLRAMQTARPIAEAFGIRPIVWPDIHEQGGIFLSRDGVTTGYGGMTRTEILEQFPNYDLPESITEAGWYSTAKGEEHFSDTMARAIRVATELRRRAQTEADTNAKIALVTHGAFMDAIIKAVLFNLPTDRYFYWHYNTAISQLDILETGVVMVRYLNRVTHLPPELVT
jgi:2,3-bisphosphoglycerate-dependent phosphoglycerate mutase